MFWSSEQTLSLVFRWLMLAVAVWAAAAIVGGIQLVGWQSTLAVALILGLLNLYLRPILTLLALPVTILTLGLFVIVINATLLGLTSRIAGHTGVHFHVDGLGAALLGAIVISLTSIVLGIFIKPTRLARDITGGY